MEGKDTLHQEGSSLPYISGRLFVGGLIELSNSGVPEPHGVLKLWCHAEIELWFTFTKSWNGTTFLPFSQPLASLTSDASGSWGYSILWNEQWFLFQWSKQFKPQNISAMKLAPVLLSAAIWGPHWSEHYMLCQCDKQAAVTVINKDSANNQDLAHILCCIHFMQHTTASSYLHATCLAVTTQ